MCRIPKSAPWRTAPLRSSVLPSEKGERKGSTSSFFARKQTLPWLGTRQLSTLLILYAGREEEKRREKKGVLPLISCSEKRADSRLALTSKPTDSLGKKLHST